MNKTVDLIIRKEHLEIWVTPEKGIHNNGIMQVTSVAFGNILYMLENEYSDGTFISNFWNLVYKHTDENGKGNIMDLFKEIKHTNIWGLDETGNSLDEINLFINGRSEIKFTLKDVEMLRIQNRINKTFLPVSIIDFDEGMEFKELSSVKEVLICILYYYAYYDYKLVKCHHCCRWFATKTFKDKYCKRHSLLDGYTHLNCEQAVRNAKQQCTRMKNRIETKSNNNFNSKYQDELYNPYITYFNNKCQPYKSKIDNLPTTENLKEYLDFLTETENSKEWKQWQQ